MPAPLNDFCVCSDHPEVGGWDSGLLLVAGEQERLGAYYVPALGAAPRWARFLDPLTEEMDEAAAASLPCARARPPFLTTSCL